MTTLLENELLLGGSKESVELSLQDGHRTTLHLARYLLTEVKPKIVVFEHETRLLDYCEDNDIKDAVGGGFFLREQGAMLGELWMNSIEQKTTPFLSPWNDVRGSIYMNGRIAIAPRNQLPTLPKGDLLQAGPVLLRQGEVVVSREDLEGFSAGSSQFDTDITEGRYPRSAIGTDERYLWCVACDGRANDEAGLTLIELADTLAKLGVKEALNLDGGSSACLVKNGRLLNRPRDTLQLYPSGRPIYNAIIIEPKK
jgi:hypothetical protein